MIEMDGEAFIPPDLDPQMVQPPIRVATTAKKVVKPSKPSPEEDDTGCLVQGVAETMRLGQSYKSIGFDKERAIVNRALADRRE
jgi:hypothetical protein